MRTCSLSHPACNAHAPYCHLPARHYSVSPHFLLNGTIFIRNIIEYKMCVLAFSTQPVWNISHCKKNGARYDHTCISVLKQSTSYSCEILMKIEFSRQIFDKYWNIKCSENPYLGAELFHDGWGDGETNMTKLIISFRKFANAPNNG